MIFVSCIYIKRRLNTIKYLHMAHHDQTEPIFMFRSAAELQINIFMVKILKCKRFINDSMRTKSFCAVAKAIWMLQGAIRLMAVPALGSGRLSWKKSHHIWNSTIDNCLYTHIYQAVLAIKWHPLETTPTPSHSPSHGRARRIAGTRHFLKRRPSPRLGLRTIAAPLRKQKTKKKEVEN